MANQQLNWEEIQIRAVKFSKTWENAKREKSETPDWVRALLRVFGITEPVGEFAKRVKRPGKTDLEMDFYWKDFIAIEMKSRGKRLDNAFEQLNNYMELLPEGDRPPLWMVSDFENIHLYYPATKQAIAFKTNKLHKYKKRFAHIAGYELEPLRLEKNAVDVMAAEKMTRLFDALQANHYKGHELEVYLARLLFCLFANDTGIFTQDSFHNYIESSAQNGSDLDVRLARLFQDLNEPEKDRVRRANISNGFDLTEFRFINGKLFEDQLRLAAFDKKMRQTLLDCLDFDWSQISPAIFGSMFQGIMNRELRREIGAHYTSEQNILKLINPLFMDDLKEEFKRIRQKNNYAALENFRDKIASLKFLDPACGCGNFLIIAYQELRLLELEIKREQKKLLAKQGTKTQKGITKHTKGIDHSLLDIETDIKVKIEQFYGIEILSWPCQIAKTGMWLMEHKMNLVFSEEFGKYVERIPLEEGATIVHGNAHRIDWESVVPKNELSYILGNPPFVGHQYRNTEQQEDMKLVYVENSKFGKLDYVCCWYQKAIEYMKGTKISAAFVSTNSIVQGESVSIMWKPIFEQGYEISFAYTPFVWSNEAKSKAAVHCVIAGFAPKGEVKTKRIFGQEGVIDAANINGYLLHAPNVFIQSRGKPLTDGMPEMSKGSQPTDGGHLILSVEERQELIDEYPQTGKLIRQYIGAEEFINGNLRYCLWLQGVAPAEYRAIKPIMQRLKNVSEMRSASPTASVQRDADTPALFTQIRQPEKKYLVIPEVSSERRKYIPIGYIEPRVIASNRLQIIPNATLYMYGVLTSNVHMAWMRVVGGRLKSDYGYQPAVYNNFPWPDATVKQKAEIEKLAQGILDARAVYQQNSLADLYDPLTMPKELSKAHNALDSAVMKLYGFAKDMDELAIVAALMERYKHLTERVK